MAGGVSALGNLLGKVNANNALVVALDGGTASATLFLAGDGTAGAPSYSFASAGNSDTGMYLVGSGDVGFVSNGTTVFHLFGESGGANAVLWLSTNTSRIDWGASADVSLSRGAANRLDLATGDSLYLVSGGLGVGTTPPSAGSIQATGNIIGAGSVFPTLSTRSSMRSPADGAMEFIDTAGTGPSSLAMGPAASATSARKLVKKVTAIADAVATDVLTVTVPNANHAAAIKLTFLSSNGSTDAFESSRVAVGTVVLARTTGVTTVATAVALTNAGIATVAAGATHTLAYGVTAMVGAAGAQQTFTVTVTIA